MFLQYGLTINAILCYSFAIFATILGCTDDTDTCCTRYVERYNFKNLNFFQTCYQLFDKTICINQDNRENVATISWFHTVLYDWDDTAFPTTNEDPPTFVVSLRPDSEHPNGAIIVGDSNGQMFISNDGLDFSPHGCCSERRTNTGSGIFFSPEISQFVSPDKAGQMWLSPDLKSFTLKPDMFDKMDDSVRDVEFFPLTHQTDPNIVKWVMLRLTDSKGEVCTGSFDTNGFRREVDWYVILLTENAQDTSVALFPSVPSRIQLTTHIENKYYTAKDSEKTTDWNVAFTITKVLGLVDFKGGYRVLIYALFNSPTYYKKTRREIHTFRSGRPQKVPYLDVRTKHCTFLGYYSWTVAKEVGVIVRMSKDGKNGVKAGYNVTGDSYFYNKGELNYPEDVHVVKCNVKGQNSIHTSTNVTVYNILIGVFLDGCICEVSYDAYFILTILLVPDPEDDYITVYANGGTPIKANTTLYSDT